MKKKKQMDIFSYMMQEAKAERETSEPGCATLPRAVFQALERVRESGVTNMLDRRAVQEYADANYDDETVIWIEENPELYTQGVFIGFEPGQDEA